jgi:hypothetical protein
LVISYRGNLFLRVILQLFFLVFAQIGRIKDLNADAGENENDQDEQLQESKDCWRANHHPISEVPELVEGFGA